MVDWHVFGIGVSAYISSLCYSVLRLEPWSTCSVACVYCYARWYRGPHGAPQPQPWVEKLFAKIARRLSGLEHPPFFRLATLAEPLQDPEPRLRLAYRIASTAVRHGVPLVINTKLPSRLLAPEWLQLLGEAADRRLVLVQVSVAARRGPDYLLEPRAEPGESRLEAVEALAREGIPVAVRVQPLIPGLEDAHEEVAVEAVLRGAGVVIGEALRLARSEVDRIARLLGLEWRGWEPYELHQVPGREGLLHPPRTWRHAIHERLRGLVEALGAMYHACKDTLSTHRIPGDCCGASLYTEAGLRVTLHEALAYRDEHGRWPSIGELCDYARSTSPRYLCGEELRRLPGPIGKTLRLHEARLARILEALREGRGGYERLVPSRPT